MLIVVENSRARLRDISTPSPQESGKEEIREGAGGWSGGDMEVLGANGLVMSSWVMLGKVISFVCGSWFPEDVEVTLTNSIFNPIETHVNSLRVFHFDSVISNTDGSAVVSLDWCSWLGMPHFFKCSPDGASLFGGEKESS